MVESEANSIGSRVFLGGTDPTHGGLEGPVSAFEQDIASQGRFDVGHDARTFERLAAD